MTLDGCYVGENINGPSLQMVGGNVQVDGGALYYGYTTSSIGCQCNGGFVEVTGGCSLNAQTNGGFRYLAVGAGGKVRFANVKASTPLGGDQYMIGDPLDYGPAMPVFAKKLGRLMTSAAYGGGARTELISGNDITTTCTTNGGMYIDALLTQTSPDWRLGEKCYQVTTYISNADFSVRLTTAAITAGLAIGTMPNSGGAIWTYINMNATLTGSAFDRLEFYRDTCVASPATFLKVIENVTADSRMVGARADSNFSQLYKC